MQISFDPQVDALYIQFQKTGKVKETLKLKDGLVVDMGANGKIFGIELLDASHRIPAGELTHVDIQLPALA